MPDADLPSRFTLFSAIAVSVGLHLAVLFALDTAESSMSLSDNTGRPNVHLTLLPSQQPAGNSSPVKTVAAETAHIAPKRVAQQPRGKTVTVASKATAPSRKMPLDNEAQTIKTPVDVPTPHLVKHAQSAQTTAATKQRLLTAIHLELTHYFSYPARARRRGWEGDVILGLTLTPEGALTGIHVAKSSGHRILDRSAKQALVQVKQIPLQQLRVLSPQQLHLPVYYRLTGT